MITDTEDISDSDNPEGSTGLGVRRDPKNPIDGKSRKRKTKEKPAVVASSKLWKADPTMAFQINQPEHCRPIGCETIVFDLSDAKDLKRWNDMQTKADSPTANFRLLDLDRQFCLKTENWKLLVTIQKVEFEDILPQMKEPKNDDYN